MGPKKLNEMAEIRQSQRLTKTPDTEAKQSRVRIAANPTQGVQRQENGLVLRLMIGTC